MTRRIDILLKSNTRSKEFFALRSKHDNYILVVVRLACRCQKFPFKFKRHLPLMPHIWHNNLPQTNKCVSLSVLVKTRNGAIRSTHDITCSTRTSGCRKLFLIVWLWLRVSMPKENDLLSRFCHVSSIVGKCALFCTFLNNDSSPKHLWFSFNSQAHARLASGCGKSCWNYFQTSYSYSFFRM